MAASLLIVDDDPAFRRLIGLTLIPAALTVVGEAATVAEATAAARSLRPDVILIDVGLPDGDGVALARHLVALPWRPRVVLTSSDPGATTAEEVRESGALGFVPKSDLPGRGIELMLGGS